MPGFKREKELIKDATETASQAINLSLVIATAALVVAGIALVVGVLK
jgi:hypothetical protein